MRSCSRFFFSSNRSFSRRFSSSTLCNSSCFFWSMKDCSSYENQTQIASLMNTNIVLLFKVLNQHQSSFLFNVRTFQWLEAHQCQSADGIEAIFLSKYHLLEVIVLLEHEFNGVDWVTNCGVIENRFTDAEPSIKLVNVPFQFLYEINVHTAQ